MVSSAQSDAHGVAHRIAVAIAFAIAIASRSSGSFAIGDGLGDGAIHLDDEVTQHRVAEAECAGQLLEGLGAAFDVHQHVVRLVHLGDRERELAPAPVFETVHGAAVRGDDAAVALDHGGNLLALVRMDQKNDLVMPHLVLPVVIASR